MRVALLYSDWRPDEERLARAAEKRGHEVARLAEEEAVLALAPLETGPEPLPDVVIERCRDHGRALVALAHFESRGVRTVNRLGVARTCGSKAHVTAALARARVPTPPTRVAFSIERALEAAQELGWPVVLKPLVGDQGALVARVDGRDAARALLEHKRALGAPGAPVYYLQRWLERPGRDLRAFVIGREVAAAVYFITNRMGAGEEDRVVAECPLTPELERVARAAAEAVGGGVLAVDLIETPEGPVVTEVNYTIEFARLDAAVGVDLAARVIAYVEAEAGPRA